MIGDYEEKFSKLKLIVHQRELVTSDLRARVAQLEEAAEKAEADLGRARGQEREAKGQLEEIRRAMQGSLED